VKLTVPQIQAAEYFARGVNPERVASELEVTAKKLQQWNTQKEFQVAIDLFRGGAIEVADHQRNAATILGSAAPQAADKLVELLDSPKDEVQKQAADSILDRSGHGKQTEIRKTVVNLDADYLRNLQQTQGMEDITPHEDVG